MRQSPALSRKSVFDVGQTHGILCRPEHHVEVSSDDLGWSSLYVSRQRECAYADTFAPVRDHLIILHLDGPVDVERRLNGAASRATIGPGGMFVMPGGTEFWVHLTAALHSVHFYVRDEVVREVMLETCTGGPDHLALTPALGVCDPVIAGLIRAADDALLHADPSSNILADYLARALASRLITRFGRRQPGRVAAGIVIDADQKRRLREFVLANLAYPIGLADLAGALGMGVTSFARAFKRDTGMTPYHYVLMERLNLAKKLLAANDKPIADIALGCGFSHQEHLTRMFRRQFETTPGAFRRALRG